MIELGIEIRFEVRISGILVDRSRHFTGVRVAGSDEDRQADVVVLAVGHSARDMYRSLKELG